MFRLFLFSYPQLIENSPESGEQMLAVSSLFEKSVVRRAWSIAGFSHAWYAFDGYLTNTVAEASQARVAFSYFFFLLQN